MIFFLAQAVKAIDKPLVHLKRFWISTKSWV